MVFGELIYGAENSKKKQEHLKQLNDFSKVVSILPITKINQKYMVK